MKISYFINGKWNMTTNMSFDSYRQEKNNRFELSIYELILHSSIGRINYTSRTLQ